MACSITTSLLIVVTAMFAMQTASVKTTPVQQVIDMLSEMKMKAVSSMKLEKKVFADYSEWVDDRSKELGFEIKTATSEIEKLTAFIDKEDSKATNLGSEIAELDTEVAQLNGDTKAATAQREDEHAEFLKVQEDYAESVDALERAIQVLKQQAYDRPQAEMLLQQMAKKNAGMKRVLAALLEVTQQKANDDGAPAVAAYSFQSDSIIAILERLREKFQGELADVEKAEANQAHAYNLEHLHLSSTIDKMTADRGEKAELRGRVTAASAEANGQLSATQADLVDDKKLLSEIKATFASKSSTFEQNQKVRTLEIEAIAEAIEIISHPDVAASYAKHVKLAQISSAPVSGHAVLLLQEGSHTGSARAIAKTQAANYLRERSSQLSSKILANLAAKIAANPFAKVIKMIEELLAKLKEEAASEADHKKWCDEELHKNKLKREKFTAKVGSLQAKVGDLEATIQKMSDEIAELSAEQARLTSAMGEASTLRTKEKATNEATIKDAQMALVAVKKALVILREFYASQSLLQESKQVPEMAEYKGMQGAKGGVIGMLEVIESDFSRLETETKAAETQAAAEYTSFMSESKASQKAKHEREFKLSLDKDQTEFEQGRLKKDLAFEEDALAKANGYYESLKSPCLVVHVSYEERVARRKEEIEALKEAYKILDTVSIA